MLCYSTYLYRIKCNTYTCQQHITRTIIQLKIIPNNIDLMISVYMRANYNMSYLCRTTNTYRMFKIKRYAQQRKELNISKYDIFQDNTFYFVDRYFIVSLLFFSEPFIHQTIYKQRKSSIGLKDFLLSTYDTI